jgi:AraC family transcriptional regulator
MVSGAVKVSQRQLRSLETEIRLISGCRVTRIIDHRNARVGEHSHDWPVLSLYLLGGYTNFTALGESRVSSPAVTLYRAGEAHANSIGDRGFEQIQIEFDPHWLGLRGLFPADPVQSWLGGPVAASARSLAAIWSKPTAPEAELRRATRSFLSFASAAAPVRRPPWLDHVAHRLASDAPPSTAELARELDMHAGWLAEAYRKTVGEGLGETVMRRRVEAAANLLRETDLPTAEVAVATGFCDQSHMIRAFRKWLGRRPAQVRSEGGDRGTLAL